MSSKISNWANANPAAVVLIFIGIVLQGIFLILQHAHGPLFTIEASELTSYDMISFLSGLLGVFAVVLCSQRKLISYVFGIAQILTYLVIVWHDALYAKIAENVFYLITMAIGIFIWNNHYDIDKVDVKRLSKKMLWILLTSTAALSTIIGYGLSFTNDIHPYIDSFTTLPAFVAQILMILRYRDQWIFWIIIDIGCIFLWLVVGNYCMVAQYIFWTINCIYGWLKWKE